MESENTHVLFDGTKVIISQDLIPIFDFLQKIDLEVDELFQLQKKVDGLRENILDLMGLIDVMGTTIKEGNLDFEYTLKENIDDIANKLEIHQLTRIQSVAVFCGIETLICLYTAYEFETSDEREIRDYVMNTEHTRKIINKLLLSPENTFFSRNRKKLSKVHATKLRNLRNSLVHFFSVKGLNLASEGLIDKARKLEKIKHDVTFISPNELYELEKAASILLLKIWSRDCSNDKNLFKLKINHVKQVVKQSGAVLIDGNNINI